MTARSTVAAMTAYTLELREAEVKLNQNEAPWDFPEELKREAVDRIVSRPWNRYPDFESTPLRTALAAACGLDPDNILVGNGSNELLAAAVGAFVGPGTPVVIPTPTFTLYEKLVTVAGGLPVPVTIDPSTGELPVDAMCQALSELRDPVVIFCSPNNPTGGVLSNDGVERLLATGATVLFDRAYAEFVDAPANQSAGASFSTPFARPNDRLVTFSTFSKAWGLAGLRVGWLASTQATCRQIRKVKLPYSLNILSETVAVLALERRGIRDGNVARLTAERDRMVTRLQQIAGITQFPSYANFITFRLDRRDGRVVFEQLCERGLLIRNVSGYRGLENCLRVTIGTREQNDRFVRAIEELA